MAKEREGFDSSAAVIMAMAGSAIGLGNIWRFPYVAGQNGGAAFIILYLLCALLMSLPIMLSEELIGRNTGKDTVGAMQKLAPGSNWKWVGLMTVLSPLIILSFYSVVGGWSIEYLNKAVVNGFGDDISTLFGQFISATWGPLICCTVFLGMTALIVSRGVKAGIERFNKISLPLLFVLIVAVAIYSVTLPGAYEGVKYLLKPDFSKITPSVFAAAMGQSFFSLSLGVGTILTYASYMRKEDNILQSGIGTTAFDLFFAFIAGFAIMPAVFAAGIEPGAGPGLIFETLPYIFAQMGADAPVLSRIISILFFVTILVAALTSSISMFEVGVAYLMQEHGMSRRKSSVVIFAGTWTLGALCSLSFGPLSGIHICGETIFSFCDKLTSNFLMSIGSLLFVFIVGWKMKKEDVRREFTNDGTQRASGKLFPVVHFMIRYIAPLVILTVFLTNLFA